MEEHHESSDKPALMTSPGRMRRGIVIVAVTLAIGFGIVFTLWDEMFANPPPVTRLQTGEPTPPPPAQAGVTQITMLAGAAVSGAPDFSPDDDATVPLGNKVVWNNADTVPHTATSGSGPEDAESGAAFDTELVNGGEESAEIDVGGEVGDVIPYYCIVHPYMTSQLTITEAEEGGGGAATGPTINIPSGASVQGNTSYEPAELTVKKGDTVTVTNADTAIHTVTSGQSGDEDSGSAFDSDLVEPSASAKIDTAAIDAGEYPYYCIVHPYMTGKLVVTE
ncbi:MAG: cupredoxin domain-containing protein [Nitrososphaera sp.]|uniref:cupredoxin domain-containing protein n=1 Tax=Nitrososphaera sp. TaxID=1971748 RepID=UPI003D6F0437